MKKFLNACSKYVSGVKFRAIALLVALGLISASALPAADVSTFIAQDGTSGAVTVDSSVVVDYLKEIVVAAYGNWMTLVIIFIVVGLICYILFKKK